VLPLSLLLAIGACVRDVGQRPVAPSHDRLLVPCERAGPLTADTSEDELKRVVGPEHVVSLGETARDRGHNAVTASILYPDTAGRLRVVWKTPRRQRPHYVETTVRGAPWKTRRGIAIGTGVYELVRLNGGDFRFRGFFWDYGGHLESWEGGLLETHHPAECFLMAIGMQAPADRRHFDALAPLTGEAVFRTDHPALRAGPIVVVLVGVRFP